MLETVYDVEGRDETGWVMRTDVAGLWLWLWLKLVGEVDSQIRHDIVSHRATTIRAVWA